MSLELTNEQQQLVLEYQYLVNLVASKYIQIPPQQFEDLKAFLTYQLCRYVCNYDASKYADLKGYLECSLRAVVRNFFRDFGFSIKPDVKREKRSGIFAAAEKGLKEYEGEPMDVLLSAAGPLPLDNDEEVSSDDFSSEVIDDIYHSWLIQQIFEALDETECQHLKMRLDEATDKEICQYFNWTPKKAKQQWEELREDVARMYSYILNHKPNFPFSPVDLETPPRLMRELAYFPLQINLTSPETGLVSVSEECTND